MRLLYFDEAVWHDKTSVVDGDLPYPFRKMPNSVDFAGNSVDF
jgi:hypothetical protein